MISRNLGHWTGAGLALGVVAAGVTLSPVIADEQVRDERDHSMELTSTTFTDNSTLPLSVVDNFPVNNITGCSRARRRIGRSVDAIVSPCI
jgi:hypothetical protein